MSFSLAFLHDGAKNPMPTAEWDPLAVASLLRLAGKSDAAVSSRCEEGEARWISHVFRLPEGAVPGSLNTLCGKEFRPGALELLRPWAGTACLPCAMSLPDGHVVSEGVLT